MATAQELEVAKYFTAFLTSDAALPPSVQDDFGAALGAIDRRSEPVTWTASKFYEREMAANLLRGFFSFAPLRGPAHLRMVKLESQQIEERFRCQDSSGGRVNLDPGYLASFKVVLASTKNANQRIYLDRGI